MNEGCITNTVYGICVKNNLNSPEDGITIVEMMRHFCWCERFIAARDKSDREI